MRSTHSYGALGKSGIPRTEYRILNPFAYLSLSCFAYIKNPCLETKSHLTGGTVSGVFATHLRQLRAALDQARGRCLLTCIHYLTTCYYLLYCTKADTPSPRTYHEVSLVCSRALFFLLVSLPLSPNLLGVLDKFVIICHA